MHYTSSSSGDSDVVEPPTVFLQYHLGYYGARFHVQLDTQTYVLTLESLTGPAVNATELLNNSREFCMSQVDSVAQHKRCTSYSFEEAVTLLLAFAVIAEQLPCGCAAKAVSLVVRTN
ncbi:hypothetical_protein [Leishmania braziliensis MHOM/BR/75/M2904]|uniref:Hypothetical_protein n=1 Tax=Leishmania braziliensis MHOM/BR/75/M2904 TaxID=420245 RepID=A0A3P3Z933_LEIBR|nr:hypothetical_protein [Leishmania braziliensis MHOM/BR/75/M2904]